MRRSQLIGQALTSSRLIAAEPYICRACLAQASRQFSTTKRRSAEKPFFTRLKDSIFGSQESKAADAALVSAREKQQARILADGTDVSLEQKQDKRGHTYKVAAIVDEKTHAGYTAAMTWDGLKSIGSAEWVKKSQDRGEEYRGFAPATSVALSDAQWNDVLHHTAVEILTLQKAGREPAQVCLPRERGSRTVHHTLRATLKAGSSIPHFSSADSEMFILQQIPEQAKTTSIVQSRNVLSSIKAVGEDVRRVSGETWMAMTLNDAAFKFALLKRTLQLTGRRVPDHVANDCKSIATLWRALKKKDEPSKLFLTSELQKVNADIPNVAVHQTRRTPIDKERQVGRWKIIKKELTLRDLPVTGSRLQNAKEGFRIDIR